MIESEPWRSRDRMPLRNFRVVVGFHFCATFEQSSKSNAHRMAAWVALRVSECADLLESNAAKPRLFFQLARSRRFERFIFVNEPAGQCPLSFERRAGTLDEQYFCALRSAVKQHYINSHGRSRVIVAILLFLFRFFPFALRFVCHF